jgi:outer membrane protein assembly factor BamB
VEATAPPQEMWKSKVLRTQMNPGVLFDGHVYASDGDTTSKAPLKCVELSTGTEKWAHEGFGTGTVIVADGKLIALSGGGELSVVPATPRGTSPSPGRRCSRGSAGRRPVLSDGRIYCRNWKGQVVCVDVRK